MNEKEIKETKAIKVLFQKLLNDSYKQKTLDYLTNNAKWYDRMCEEFETLPVHTYEEIDAMDIKEEPKDYEDL